MEHECAPCLPHSRIRLKSVLSLSVLSISIEQLRGLKHEKAKNPKERWGRVRPVLAWRPILQNCFSRKLLSTEPLAHNRKAVTESAKQGCTNFPSPHNSQFFSLSSSRSRRSFFSTPCPPSTPIKSQWPRSALVSSSVRPDRFVRHSGTNSRARARSRFVLEAQVSQGALHRAFGRPPQDHERAAQQGAP